MATLNRVDADDFSWNVPGLREELVTGLIRSLPKELRVHVVPAPDTAREFLKAVPPGEEPLLDALARHLRSTRGVVVPREAWDWSKVPDHLRPTYRVVDDTGAEQARGKDIEALKEPLRPQFERAIADVAADSGLSRTGETSWVFGEIPESSTLTRAGHQVTVFPALVDEGATVGLAVVGSGDEAEARHRLGVRRLLLIGLGDRGRVDQRELTSAEKLALAGSPYPSVAELLEDCRAAVVQSVVDERPAVRTKEEYDEALVAAAAELPERVRAVVADVLRVLDAWRQAERRLSGRADMAQLPALTDMRAQLARLVHPGFVGEAGLEQLRRYSVYLAALAARRDAARRGRCRGQPGPAADGPGHRPAGVVPPPGRGPAPGSAARRAAAARPVDARGVPRLAVGPAARHGLPGQ